MRRLPWRKQSQFVPGVSSFKLEVSSLHTSHFKLYTSWKPPYGVTTGEGARCAKQSQFAEGRNEL